MISLEEMKSWRIEEDESVHNDESKKPLIDDDFAMNNKIAKSPNHKDGNTFNHLFKNKPGDTRLINKMKPLKYSDPMKKLKMPKGINFNKKIKKMI